MRASNNANIGTKATNSELQDLVIESDSGARKPSGISAAIMFSLALLWALFQLWISSPLPYNEFFSSTLGIPIFSSTYARYVHLAFALSIAFLSYPATKKSPRNYIPLFDWFFAAMAIVSIMYLYVFKDELARRIGLPTTVDVAIAIAGMLVLLEGARRALGPPLVIIACIFLFYTFAGSASFMPDVIAHKGQSLNKVASHQWITTEGVFGIAIGVSTDFVFLFVLFGALLEKAGAGNYFIKLAFSMLGHLRGGPAKAAVLASAMTGLISGSSIANVVTTGTFTVPLMRKVGFSREKAGAVEVASSVNGQIMPPVMGAAAFLMVEYVGISYIEVVKAAFIPAVISYIALFYIVHLEALKSGMKAIPKTQAHSFLMRTALMGIVICSFIILACVVYYGIGWVKTVSGEYSLQAVGSLVLASYIGMLYYSAKHPPLEAENPNSKIIELPKTWETFRTGFHYILPIIVLVWCLMVERLSPGLSAFWATVFMIFIIVTQNPLLSFFKGNKSLKKEWIYAGIDLVDGLIIGARNMVAIGIATAAAGIVVGSVSLTGIGQVMTELVEVVSGGSFILVLIFTAFICLVLGMGLPTTANYIVVASLMATVIEELGRKNGLYIPLIAIHLFVFYFGIMADVTPPVGLASFAAAAVSGGDPIKTGVQAFIYSIRTVILPFIFIYNTDLLLIGVTTVWPAVAIFVKATIAILVFAAATQGYFIVRSKKYESLILLFVAFSLFRPGYLVDKITPPYAEAKVYEIENIIEQVPVGKSIRIGVSGEDLLGDEKTFKTVIKITADGTATEKLEEFGLLLVKDGRRVIVDDVVFNSEANKAGFDFDFEIISLEVPQDQISKKWVYGFAFLLLALVGRSQYSRKTEIYQVNVN